MMIMKWLGIKQHDTTTKPSYTVLRNDIQQKDHLTYDERPQEKTRTLDHTREAVLKRIVETKPIYGYSETTHHLFSGARLPQLLFSPVTLSIKEFNSDKNNNVEISWKALDRIHTPFIKILAVTIEHSQPITNLIYQGITIHPILLKTKQYDGGGGGGSGNASLYMSELPLQGFPSCMRSTNADAKIDLHCECGEERSGFKVHVECVQSAMYNDTLALSANQQDRQVSMMNIVKTMNYDKDNKVYYYAINKNCTAFIFSCIVVVPQTETSECTGIHAIIEGDNNSCAKPLVVHQVSGNYARMRYARDPMSTVNAHGFQGYTLPFTCAVLHSSPVLNTDMNNVFPPGAINMGVLKAENKQLIIKAQFTHELQTPPLLIVSNGGITKVYV